MLIIVLRLFYNNIILYIEINNSNALFYTDSTKLFSKKKNKTLSDNENEQINRAVKIT